MGKTEIQRVRWLADSLRSEDCPGCHGDKLHRQSFCRGCYKRLPPKLKAELYNRIGEGYEEAHAASMEHLGAEYDD